MSAPVLLTPAEAAAWGRRHPDTVRRALEAGVLHGSQRVPRGRWVVARECLEAWLAGRACAHQEAAAAAERRAWVDAQVRALTGRGGRRVTTTGRTARREGTG